MNVTNLRDYFNERVKPYHVKIRDMTTNTAARETCTVESKEQLIITETIFNHHLQQVDTTIGYNAKSFDGIYDSIIFKKDASYIKVFVDGALMANVDWVDGFWNGTTFTAVPIDNVCNAIQLSATYASDKDVWVIGVHSTTFAYSTGTAFQILFFGDAVSDNPNSNIWFKKNSKSVDVLINTGEYLNFEEGFWDGMTFNTSPVDGICNAVKLINEMYNDTTELRVTLRVHFAVQQTLIASNDICYFTGDVRVAYDWPNTNSPGPNDFFYEMVIIDDSIINSTTEILNLT